MTADRPNILLIVVHDLGTHLRCYDWDPLIPSDNLDRLAADGVQFTQHFTTATFCRPSRGSIITGKYPHSNGLMGLTNLGWDLPESNRILAQLLREAGYTTALIGLQHEVKDVVQLGFEFVSERKTSWSCDHVAPMVADYLTDRAENRAKWAGA